MRVEQRYELAGFGRRGDVEMHRVGSPVHVELQERAALLFLRHEPLELRRSTEAIAKVQRAAFLFMVQQRVVGQCADFGKAGPQLPCLQRAGDRHTDTSVPVVHDEALAPPPAQEDGGQPQAAADAAAASRARARRRL